MDPTPTTVPSIPISFLLHVLPVQANPVAPVERQVEDALDELVAIGALWVGNRMDIEALLNPAGKSHILTETSDKEIYQAVIDSISTCENIEINGGDDVDDDGPVEPHPTRHEVLKAVSTIGKYTNNLNDPFSWKIKALLGLFTQQLRLEETRHIKNGVLTDFSSSHEYYHGYNCYS